MYVQELFVTTSDPPRFRTGSIYLLHNDIEILIDKNLPEQLRI